VEPSRRVADLIIPEGGNNRVAIEVIVDRIRRELLTLTEAERRHDDPQTLDIAQTRREAI